MSAPDPEMTATFRRLNESFYSSSPSLYFEQRLNSLLVVAADDPEYGERLRSGLTIVGQTFTVAPNERVESRLSGEDVRRFVTSETQVLLHHAAESLLRLYLAHEGRPPCPWLNIASLGSFRQFWRAIDDRFVKPAPREGRVDPLVAETFLGSPVYPTSWPTDENDWASTVERLSIWMRFFSRHLSEDAPIYNAAKHGFALCSEEAYFAFKNDEGRTLISHSGPSLEMLVHGDWANNERRWSIRTVWTNPVASWFFCNVAIQMMESIFRVGRFRHLGEAGGYLFNPDFTPIDVQTQAGVGGIKKFETALPLIERK